MTRPRTLSVITLNTWKCDGRYRDRLRLMAAEAKRLSPDILLLQEAFSAPATATTQAADTAADLAEALCCGLAIAPARDKTRDFEGAAVRSRSGLAILTRGQILSNRSIALPVPKGDDDRISQIAEIDIDGLRLLAVNTHLTHVRDRDDARQREIAATVAALAPMADYDAALFGGDFNCPPDSPPIAWLLTESGLRVTDICAAAGADFITNEGSARRPPQRIDHVFLLETGSTRRVAIKDAARVFDTKDPALGIMPSDHYGVRVRIAVGG